jgi:molybdenum cofactor cytidylyltransferase
MGRSKALLPLPDGSTFLTGLLRTLSDAAVEDLVVVLGHEAAAVEANVRHVQPPVRVVINDAYRSGQLSSVLAGLDAVDRPDVAAMLLALVDAPLVSARTVRSLIDRYHTTHALIVRPVHHQRHGHPVIVDRSLFEAIRAADPSTGIKPIVRANASDAGDVQVDDQGAFLDVDTAADYEQLLNGMRGPMQGFRR